MQQLKYFMPLIIEANKRSISSRVYYTSVKKCYAEPSNHMNVLKEYSDQYRFDLLPYTTQFEGLTFLLENRWPSNLPHKTYKVVLPLMLSFTHSSFYDVYINQVNAVVFPSRFMAEHYGKTSPKNIYLGTPKYDVQLDEEVIRQKYDIQTKKNALLVYPHPMGGGELDLQEITDRLHNLGYTVIVKSRNKFSTYLKNRNLPIFEGDRYFEDVTWFPHTMLELMEISDVVINTDSSTNKECVMLDTPLVNFHVKIDPARYPESRPYLYDYLYDYPFHIELDPQTELDKLEESVEYLTEHNFSDYFIDARTKYLFPKGTNVSAKILDEFSCHL